ncbi:MAG: segregation/condensation protein A [Planctomycetota bacterium]
MTQDYNVRLSQFHGPLDLLLHLIRRAELDVSEIALGEIADQYLEFLGGVDDIDIEAASEFLVTAATLVEVKSRQIERRRQGDEEGGVGDALAGFEDDAPGASLLKQLLAYRAYRDAGDRLVELRSNWDERWPVSKAGVSRDLEAVANRDEAFDLEDVTLEDLVQAFERVADAVVFERMGDHEVLDDDTPIELHQVDLLDQLSRIEGGGLSLGRVFSQRTKGEAVGLFIAVLELVRDRKLRIRQAEIGGEIELHAPEPEQDQDGPLITVRRAEVASWDDDHVLDEGEDAGDPNDED